jgi:hypothetical protein
MIRGSAPSAAVRCRRLSPASADNPSLRPPQISRPAVPCSPTLTSEQQDGDGGGEGSARPRSAPAAQRPSPASARRSQRQGREGGLDTLLSSVLSVRIGTELKDPKPNGSLFGSDFLGTESSR